MSDLGHYLKSNREEQGISLEKLQELTKIQKRYLAAIEEGRHDALPGAFYARAFVKSYAEALGLNPEEVLETYGSELPQPKQQTSDLPSRTERTKPQLQKKKKKNKVTVLPVLFGLIFFVVVAAGIYLIVQGNANDSSEGVTPKNDPSIEVDSNEEGQQDDTSEKSQQKDEQKKRSDDTSSDNEDTNDEKDMKDETTEEEKNKGEAPELVSSNNRRSVYDVSGNEEMIFELELNGKSYIDVQNENGSIIEDFTGAKPGDTIELDYSDREYVDLNIGNTTAVTVRFNGEVIEYESDVAHQHLIFDKTLN